MMHAVRVITWNMGLADRARRFVKTHEEAWRYLLGLNPDIAFLQEAFPPDWVESEGAVVRDPFKKWGSLVFSRRLAIEPFALPQNSSLRALPNYLAFAEVPLPDGSQAIGASIHAPPRRAEGDILGGRDPAELRRSVEGPKHNDAIFAGLTPLVEGRLFILAGDWNTARRQGTPRASRAGEEFFARVREAGWYDCVWAKRQSEIRTWFGPGKLQQDDYVFCDPSLGQSVAGVSVAEEATTDRGLSDHAPLVIDFDIGSTAIGPLSK
jgi:endonuclease/exonuclease/phosphatase family metal-dependent hydrolase